MASRRHGLLVNTRPERQNVFTNAPGGRHGATEVRPALAHPRCACPACFALYRSLLHIFLRTHDGYGLIRRPASTDLPGRPVPGSYSFLKDEALDRRIHRYAQSFISADTQPFKVPKPHVWNARYPRAVGEDVSARHTPTTERSLL